MLTTVGWEPYSGTWQQQSTFSATVVIVGSACVASYSCGLFDYDSDRDCNLLFEMWFTTATSPWQLATSARESTVLYCSVLYNLISAAGKHHIKTNPRMRIRLARDPGRSLLAVTSLVCPRVQYRSSKSGCISLTETLVMFPRCQVRRDQKHWPLKGS